MLVKPTHEQIKTQRVRLFRERQEMGRAKSPASILCNFIDFLAQGKLRALWQVPSEEKSSYVKAPGGVDAESNSAQ